MKLQQHTYYITFQSGESRFMFLPSGDIFEFTQGGILINEFQGCPKEGSVNNIWLRIYRGDGIHSYPLLGIRSESKLAKAENALIFTGRAETVAYKVTFFAASEGLWFWNVELFANGETVDIVYGQDIGVAEKGGVLSNELYTAQYLGHTVLETENGYKICSRQNLPQDGSFPYLQQGMIQGRAVGYSTDGMQFFGCTSESTGIPEALGGHLPNQNYQFEFSFTALQSEKMQMNGSRSLTFYGLFKPSHEDAVREPEYEQEIQEAFAVLRQPDVAVACPVPHIRACFDSPLTSPEWNESEIAAWFPMRKLEERENGELLSFFTENHTHVVLRPKELRTERPHGHIISSRMNPDRVDSSIITSTNYMYGLFNGQTVVGNTSFHKLLSTPRGLLNILKNSGQRLYVLLDGKYRMLTLPAAYEMGVNYSRWYYKLREDTLIVTSFAAAGSPDIVLEVRSTAGREYRFLLTNQLVLGENEFQQPVALTRTGPDQQILRFTPDPKYWAENPYPGLHYDMQLEGAQYTLSDDRIFFEDGESRDGTLLCVAIEACSRFQCIMQGRLEEEEPVPSAAYDFDREFKQFTRFYKEMTRGFRLEMPGTFSEDLESLNETVWWFSHNAMMHYAVPHGLEQPGGAAWGTRDVCQGPMEYFFAMQQYSLAREVLLAVFSHQNAESGEWPQWFMFDRYSANAGECHGDVILWPLKAIGDYLDQTGDYTILHETVPYTDDSGKPAAGREESIFGHIAFAVKTLERRFLAGTALISYAGGDWDDTLQPADESMKDHLVSAWTQALSYQVLRLIGGCLKDIQPTFAAYTLALSQRIRSAFDEYLIRNGIIAGFARRQPDGSFTYLLHPDDDTTGIHYRLLPMTRSIIAELANKEQANRNISLIDRHLRFPDGVRIMDRPARYDGGVSHLFRRAEQAANVGREISLQYTHAHIRYLEAMAKSGEAERAWSGLFTVNPITVRRYVPNAALRQSNVYFSSSDGMFSDRYRYAAEFEKLRDGSVGVKGGWRLYSSGPGIYLHQLISNILGIRFMGGDLILDPVLPVRMDGLHFTFACFGHETTFIYHIVPERSGKLRVTRGGEEVAGIVLENPYRPGGIRIPRGVFEKGAGDIEIELL